LATLIEAMRLAEETTRPVLALVLACGTLAIGVTWGIALAVLALGRRRAHPG